MLMKNKGKRKCLQWVVRDGICKEEVYEQIPYNKWVIHTEVLIKRIPGKDKSYGTGPKADVGWI